MSASVVPAASLLHLSRQGEFEATSRASVGAIKAVSNASGSTDLPAMASMMRVQYDCTAQQERMMKLRERGSCGHALGGAW